MADWRLVKEIVRRVGRAALAGVITFIWSYLIPSFFIGPSMAGDFVTMAGPSPGELLRYFATIVVFYAIAIELAKGTVLEHAFSIGRELTLLFYFIYAMGGGVMEMVIRAPPIPPLEEPVEMVLKLDVSPLLAMVICIDLIGIGKGLLNAVYFLSQKAEEELMAE